MPTTIDSAGITFNDATSLTSATLAANSVGATQITNGSVTAVKLGTTEQKQICKAWVNFNGTTSPGTIRSSYNVSSVTKNGTGDYTVNFATPMADANYSAILTTGDITSANNSNRAAVDRSHLVSSVSVITFICTTGGASDMPSVSIAIFGN